MHEVYAYGVIAASTLVEIEGGFPAEAGYAEIRTVHPSLGGEAAGAAYVLSRLGVATKLSGNGLSADSESRRVLDLLTSAGVDCSAIATDVDHPVIEYVISGDGERTVFGTYARMLADEAWSQPSRRDIASAQVVCLDPFFGEASLQAGRWCVEAAVPYVTVDAPPDSDLVRNAAVVIMSEEFALRIVESYDPEAVLSMIGGRCDGLSILTRGSKPLLYGRGSGPIISFAPYAVDARDTTGAGDSFRAGIVYGLLRGYDDRRLVGTAAKVAAMVSQTSPGVLNSPTVDELEGFDATTG